ncbi:MAG: hypothetical protein JKY60_15380 [Kordiimonadaceae bacterium]|nr:hypothetical protein [Kordiimonadaceae bacterium]
MTGTASQERDFKPASDRELAHNFSSWRVQGACIAQALKNRGRKRDGKRLAQILELLDLLWNIDFGDAYPEELSKVIQAHNANVKKAECSEVQI